jgi:hypothetical protein
MLNIYIKNPYQTLENPIQDILISAAGKILLKHLTKLPSNIVLFTVEVVFDRKDCEIYILLYKNGDLLGRREEIEKCIFHDFPESYEHTVILNSVKNHESYLELDHNVQSELFRSIKITDGIDFIVNAELKTKRVDDNDIAWFEELIGDITNGL